MSAERLLEPLASSTPDEPALRAAGELLRTEDTDGEIDALYPELLRQQVLLSVLANLEHAGGDLGRLSLSSELFRSRWPLGALLPRLGEASPGRISLASLRDAVEEHKALLRDLVRGLVERSGEGSFMVLFGTALEAAYPSYRHRQHHDADLFASDARAGLQLVDVLWERMGFVLLRFRMSGPGRRRLAHFKLVRTTDAGHQLHVDVIAGGRPAGPGLRPPLLHPPLAARARCVDASGAKLSVPSPEDMVLLLAEKTYRKRTFTLRDLNDARYLLVAHEGDLDWNYLCSSAVRHRVGGGLHHLAGAAERKEGRPLAPPGELHRLAPGAQEGRAIAAVAVRSSERDRSLWGALWFLRSVSSPRAIGRFLADRTQALALKLEFRAARSGMTRRLRQLDPDTRRVLILGAVHNPEAMDHDRSPGADAE